MAYFGHFRVIDYRPFWPTVQEPAARFFWKKFSEKKKFSKKITKKWPKFRIFRHIFRIFIFFEKKFFKKISRMVLVESASKSKFGKIFKKKFWNFFGMKFFWIFFRKILFFSKSARGFDFLFERNGSSGVLGTRIYPQNRLAKRKIEHFLSIIREEIFACKMHAFYKFWRKMQKMHVKIQDLVSKLHVQAKKKVKCIAFLPKIANNACMHNAFLGKIPKLHTMQ